MKTSKIKFSFFILFCFNTTPFLSGQEFIETKELVNEVLVVPKDNNTFLFIDENTLFKASYDTFKKTKLFDVARPTNSKIGKLEFADHLLKIKYQDQSQYKANLAGSITDSTFVYDNNGQLIQKLPGFLSFDKKDSLIVIAGNESFNYFDEINNLNRIIPNEFLGFIYAQTSSTQNKIPIEAVIIDVKIINKNEILLLLEKGFKEYELRKINLNTKETTHTFTYNGQVLDFHLSEPKNLILVKTTKNGLKQLYKEYDFLILNSSNLTEIKSLEGNNARSPFLENEFYFSREGIYNYKKKYNSNKLDYYETITGLQELDFTNLGGGKFILHSNNLEPYGLKDKNGLIKYDFKPYEELDKVEWTSRTDITYQYFDPNQVDLITNTSINEYKPIYVDENESLLLNDGNLWDLNSKKRLLSLPNSESVKYYLSDNGKEILFLEKHKRKNNYYLFSTLKIKTGKIDVGEIQKIESTYNGFSTQSEFIGNEGENWLFKNGKKVFAYNTEQDSVFESNSDVIKKDSKENLIAKYKSQLTSENLTFDLHNFRFDDGIEFNNAGQLLLNSTFLINLNDVSVNNIKQDDTRFYRESSVSDFDLLQLNSGGFSSKSDTLVLKINDSIIWTSAAIKRKEDLTDSYLLNGKDYGVLLYANEMKIYVLNKKTKSLDVFKLDSKSKKSESFYEKSKLKNFKFSDPNTLFITFSNYKKNEVLKQEHQVYVIDLESLTEIHSFVTENNITDYHSNNQFLINNYGYGKLFDYQNQTLKETQLYITPSGHEDLIFDGKTVIGSLYNTVRFYKKNQNIPFKILQLNTSTIERLYTNQTFILALSDKNEIFFINKDSLEVAVVLHLIQDGNEVRLAWTTPEGYFMAPKNVIRNFHFVKNSKAFPLLNYELFLNRPDIILSRLGYSSSATVELYKNAYLKRLQRNQVDETTDLLSLQVPEINLINDKIPAQSQTKQFPISMQSKSKLKRLNLYVNGVPVESLKNIQSNQIVESKIELSNGQNRIGIVGVSENGIESNPIYIETEYNDTGIKPTIHYFGIGVSEYQDSIMNLKYAAKDVSRLNKMFADLFKDDVKSYNIENKEATKENIQQLKEKLLKTKVDDIVILSFSGHGQLGKNDEFYFAPYEHNFQSPDLNGLSYQEIQDLVSDIPARRKLILIDACHSGEIDSDSEFKNTVIKNKNVTVQAVEGAKGLGGIGSSQKSSKDAFDLMKQLFYDLDRGNGSYVISASGGFEFAFEGDEWNNGVFTYSFIKAFKQLYFKEKEVKISKLKDLVFTSVSNLTNNNQVPTSRQENIEWDWGFKNK